MPRGKKGTRKGTKKGRPAGAKRREPRAAVPSFHTFATTTAGAAAAGLRVGFPAERTVALTYADYFAWSGAVGAMGQYQFRLNSAYDPNYTSAGHQPMGFDQWSLFYNHYVVEECEYQVHVASTSGILVNYTTHLSDDPTVPASFTELVELGAASTLWVPATPAYIFKGRVSFAKFFNRGSIATDSELRATVSANPTEQCILTLSASATDGSSTVANIAHVKLTMRVRFMEPKDLAPSYLRSAGGLTSRMSETANGNPIGSVAQYHADVAEGLIDPPPGVLEHERRWFEAETRKSWSPRQQAQWDAEQASYAAHVARLEAIAVARLDELTGPEYQLVTRKGSRSGSGTRGA